VSAASVVPLVPAVVAADVPEREYRRLLGLPRGTELSDDLRERAEWARGWYASQGRPFVAARRVGITALGQQSVSVEGGQTLTSGVLAERLREGKAHAAVALAASAGPEAADEATRLWNDGRPDEGYFLDRFAAAVAESLVQRASAVLCARFLPQGEWLLAHLSPGCGHWDIADQHRLMALLVGRAGSEIDGAAEMTVGPVTLLSSGALRPQHSVLAALGVTREPQPGRTAIPCRSCDLDSCSFRRVPYRQDELRSRVTP
jgi:hypothetical protein